MAMSRRLGPLVGLVRAAPAHPPHTFCLNIASLPVRDEFKAMFEERENIHTITCSAASSAKPRSASIVQICLQHVSYTWIEAKA